MILRDIKVLDFTRLLPGPVATKWLAEAGAEVVKIEDPDRPDGMRLYSQGPFEKAALYETLNHSKAVLADIPFENLHRSERFMELLKTADVLLEQFKPGLMEKLGLGYEHLSRINPRLVYISLSGYGPDRNEPGHDLNFMAEAGLLYLLRDSLGKPVIPHFQMADVSGSYACYAAVLEGLLQRGQTGRGSLRQVNLLASVLPFGIVPYRFGEAGIPQMADFLAGGIPNYNVYHCADGEYVALAALEFHLWKNAIAALDIPEGLQPAFNNPSMVPHMQDFFFGKTSAEWLALAQGKNCCLSPVCRPADKSFNTINKKQITTFKLENGGTGHAIKSPFR